MLTRVLAVKTKGDDKMASMAMRAGADQLEARAAQIEVAQGQANSQSASNEGADKKRNEVEDLPPPKTPDAAI